MANYRLSDMEKYQKEYHDNRQTINQRRQPERVARGNYRIDRNGEPVVRQNTSSRESYYQTQSQNRNQYRNYRTNQPEIEEDYYEPKWQRQEQESAPIAYLPTGKIKLFSIFVVLCLVLIVAGWRMLPMHYVNGVTVSGNTYVASENIIASTGIENWFTVKDVMAQRKTVENNILQANPLISSVTLQRNNWAAINLAVEERQVVARLKEGNQWIPVLDNGMWGEISHQLSTQQTADLMSYPILLATSQSGKLTELTTMLKDTPAELRQQIETIQLSQDANKPMALEAKMKDGNTVKAITSTFNQKMKYYANMVTAVGNRKGIINLEVGAYFTPYNGQQVQTPLPAGR